MKICISSPITEESLRRELKNFNVSSIAPHEALNNYTCIEIPENNILELIYEWCRDNLGDNWIWSNPPQTDYVKLWFKSEYDAVVFKLKFNTLSV